jgi:hypothetical protein
VLDGGAQAGRKERHGCEKGRGGARKKVRVERQKTKKHTDQAPLLFFAALFFVSTAPTHSRTKKNNMPEQTERGNKHFKTKKSKR